MHLKFVALFKAFSVRPGFLSVTLDLDEANAARANAVCGLTGVIDSVRVTKGQGGVRDSAFLESTSVLPSGGRRFVFAFPRTMSDTTDGMPVGSQALEVMVGRQVVVEVKKHAS